MELTKYIFLDISAHGHVIFQLERFFSGMLPSERWTIIEPFLAKVERNGIVMAIGGAPGNVMTIGELHWSLSTGTLFPATVSENIPAFLCNISPGITIFRWKIAVSTSILKRSSTTTAYRRFLEG